jgi:hypothetical protein
MPDEIRQAKPVPREENPFRAEEPVVAGEVDEPKEEESIDLVDLEGDGSGAAATQIRAFGRGARSVATEIRDEDVLKRALNVSGQGATRTRTFHSKLNDAALALMDQGINEWIDSAGVEIKCVSSCIGVFEGKKPEPHLILTAWY